MSLKRKTLDALKAKEELKALDEKVLSRIAANAVKTGKIKSEDDVQQYVDDITLNEAVSIYADSRSTDATQHSVENYEKKYGLKDGKPLATQTTKKEDDDDDDDDITDGDETKEDKSDGKGKKGGEGANGKQSDTQMPKYMKEMMDGMKAMREEIARLKSERTASTRKEAFIKAIAKAPEKMQQRLKRDYSRMNFKDEEDFNKYLEEIQDDIDDAPDETGAGAEQQQTQNILGAGSKSTIVGQPKGGTKTSPQYKPNPYVQARVDARKNETPVSVAVQGLPANSQQH